MSEILPIKNAYYHSFNEKIPSTADPKRFIEFYKKTGESEEVISLLNMKLDKFKTINDTSIYLRFSAHDTTLFYVGNFDSIPKIGSNFKKGETITITKKPNFEREISVAVASNKKFSMFKYVIE